MAACIRGSPSSATALSLRRPSASLCAAEERISLPNRKSYHPLRAEAASSGRSWLISRSKYHRLESVVLKCRPLSRKRSDGSHRPRGRGDADGEGEQRLDSTREEGSSAADGSEEATSSRDQGTGFQVLAEEQGSGVEGVQIRSPDSVEEPRPESPRDSDGRPLGSNIDCDATGQGGATGASRSSFASIDADEAPMRSDSGSPEMEGQDSSSGPGGGDERGEAFQQRKEAHQWAVLQKRIAAAREREVGSARATARNWRLGRCQHKVVAVLEDWVRRIRFSGEVVAVGLFSGQVSLRSLASHAELARFKGHPSEITALDFDGTHLVAGSEASVFLAWDTTSSVGLSDLGTSFRGHTKAVTGLQLDGPEVISSSEDGTVRVWHLATGECLHVARAGYPVRCVARDGELLVMGLSNGTAVAYSMSTQKLACTFQGHSDSVNCLHYNALARRLVTGSSDGTLRLWDSWTGQCLHTLQGHMAPVVGAQFDDAKVVSAARDGSVRVWDAQTGKSLYSIQGHTAYIGSVQYDATRLITDGMNNVVICHDFGAEEEGS